MTQPDPPQDDDGTRPSVPEAINTAALRELRSLLQTFHTEPGSKDARRAVARITPTELAGRLNRLAALERSDLDAYARHS